MSFDFSAVSSPFRMQPGLKRLAPGAPQLTANQVGDRALIEKLQVLSEHADQALLVEPDFDFKPALRALSLHAAAEHPQAFASDGTSIWHSRNLGWSVRGHDVEGDGPAELGDCLRALPASWRAAALTAFTFAEDFAVIDGATTRIPWLAVCLPSHWAPEDKVGRPFAQVHAPVADNQTLIAASDHLARLVTGNDRWERFVWTISRDPHLSQHPKRVDPPPWPAAAEADADALVARAYFRTERQTFIPVAGQAQAIFTIHVESQPLADAIASKAQAQQLHDALATMSQSVLAYRDLAEPRDRLLDWLSRHARGADALPSDR